MNLAMLAQPPANPSKGARAAFFIAPAKWGKAYEPSTYASQADGRVLANGHPNRAAFLGAAVDELGRASWTEIVK